MCSSLSFATWHSYINSPFRNEISVEICSRAYVSTHVTISLTVHYTNMSIIAIPLVIITTPMKFVTFPQHFSEMYAVYNYVSRSQWYSHVNKNRFKLASSLKISSSYSRLGLRNNVPCYPPPLSCSFLSTLPVQGVVNRIKTLKTPICG